MNPSTKRIALLIAVPLVLAACSGGYQRGIFTGYVVDSTEEEITKKIGKPDAIDNSNPNAPRWTYNKKTFDPENQNKTDEKTIVVLRKDLNTGKLVGAEVQYL
ncbi:MAG: hypothetical protein U1F15_15790 [Burkholderiales bacterium]